MVTSPSPDYAITAMYSVPDDAWYLELDLVREHRAVVTAVIPDEDPAREPTVCFDPQGRHLDIPYEVMRWFMDQVADEIRTSRAWMRLRPELVEVIHRLRQESLGFIEDADFPDVLAELRAAVSDADLPAVLAAAFGRDPDGSLLDGGQVFRLVDAIAVGRDHCPAAPPTEVDGWC
ncbi:hypothetical protein GCM10018790_75480 [Kitasatospora xanthocidica]|uniref:hypothetical protein n=1 Tax=Kitasatospora xanthocidica TaxID=83382 RepID=UPI0019C69CB9|nr:hypothetical protein [Kitasatospora xanthocidica]GHF86881.1 hypothetical protein GCM10018790_75480 [Kitasatospora xanthocidica]